MKKLSALLLILLPMLVSGQSSYEYLRIGDVRFTSYTQKGSIDSVLFEVRPKGIYSEVSMTLNLSTRGTSYKSGDSLEIQMSFTLPDKTEITDMWLWVGNTPVQADILDRWTAGLIYENIVKRRTDPAILYKYKANIWSYYSSTGSSLDLYMFRIFPLMTDMPRKAKITMLLPTADLNTANPYVTLPMNMLKLSYNSISKTTIRYYPEFNMGVPQLVENRSLHFSSGTDPVNGDYYQTTIPSLTSYKSLSLEYENTSFSNTFTGVISDPGSGDKFYQMQVMPSGIFNISDNKKTLILFDYIEDLSSNVKGTELLSELKRIMHNTLKTGDSFNIAFSGMFSNFISSTWIPADYNSIENTLNPIIANYKSYIKSYSSLPTLLFDGIDFIQQHKNKGKIVLISSSNSHGSQNVANGLVTDLLNQMGSNKIPIFVVDLNTSYSGYNIGGKTFYGNEYLYYNLCVQTLADYIRNASVTNMLDATFKKIGGNFKSFDIYVTLESGFTYSNYNLGNAHTIVYFDQPVLLSGKYTGTGRFHIIINAQLTNGQFVNKDYYIDNSQLIEMDLVTKTIWSAWYLRDLYTLAQTNYSVNQIIQSSIDSRVLSYYTAFLALEPGQGPLPVETENSGGGGGGSSIINEMNNVLTGIALFPNPAHDIINLDYELTKSANVVIEIFDLMGKKVLSVGSETQNIGKKHRQIDVSSLKQGTYICRLSAGNSDVKTLKLLIN
jgi:Ca-activated chloride channel family protein